MLETFSQTGKVSLACQPSLKGVLVLSFVKVTMPVAANGGAFQIVRKTGL